MGPVFSAETLERFSLGIQLQTRNRRVLTKPEISFAAAAAAAAAKSLRSCLTLCDPIDGSPLSSSVSGILQARVLKRVAISLMPPIPRLYQGDQPLL